MPPRELFYALVALAFGHAVAVTMAMYRRPKPQQEVEEVTQPTEEFYQGALPLFEEKNAELVAKLRRIAKDLGARNPDGITADDIHAVCPIPPGVDPRIMGAAFEKGLWVKKGWIPSRRRECHGRPVRVWARKAA